VSVLGSDFPTTSTGVRVEVGSTPGIPSNGSSFSAALAGVQGGLSGHATTFGRAIIGPSLTQSREHWLVRGGRIDISSADTHSVTMRGDFGTGRLAHSVDRDCVSRETGEGQVQAMSSPAPTSVARHLGQGCRQRNVRCHGGVYDKSGAVCVRSPPALRRWPGGPTRLDGGHVFVSG